MQHDVLSPRWGQGRFVFRRFREVLSGRMEIAMRLAGDELGIEEGAVADGASIRHRRALSLRY